MQNFAKLRLCAAFVSLRCHPLPAFADPSTRSPVAGWSSNRLDEFTVDEPYVMAEGETGVSCSHLFRLKTGEYTILAGEKFMNRHTACLLRAVKAPVPAPVMGIR